MRTSEEVRYEFGDARIYRTHVIRTNTKGEEFVDTPVGQLIVRRDADRTPFVRIQTHAHTNRA